MESGRISNYKIGLHRFILHCWVRNPAVALQPCPSGYITHIKGDLSRKKYPKSNVQRELRVRIYGLMKKL